MPRLRIVFASRLFILANSYFKNYTSFGAAVALYKIMKQRIILILLLIVSYTSNAQYGVYGKWIEINRYAVTQKWRVISPLKLVGEHTKSIQYAKQYCTETYFNAHMNGEDECTMLRYQYSSTSAYQLAKTALNIKPYDDEMKDLHGFPKTVRVYGKTISGRDLFIGYDDTNNTIIEGMAEKYKQY